MKENSIYETLRDTKNRLAYRRHHDVSYSSHYHFVIELFVLLKGEYEVYLNGETFKISTPPRAILSDSFDVHGYKKLSDDADCMILLIPSNNSIDYRASMTGKRLKSNILTNEEAVLEIARLLETIDKTDDNYLKNCYVNAILRIFTIHCGTVERKENTQFNTLRNILIYINENFRKDITLHSIASEFNYSESHLSRIFHSVFSCSINTYINKLRIEYINQHKHSSNKKILDLIYDAGFQSPQSYYRNLKKSDDTFNHILDED